MWFASLILATMSGDELAKPFLALADSGPISVDTGHAAPYLYDWNRDGKQDLLVGQFGEGKLRVYVNRGSSGKPSFKDYFYVKAGTSDLSVPAG